MAREKSAFFETAVFKLIGLTCLPFVLVPYAGPKAYLMSGFFLLILILVVVVHLKRNRERLEPVAEVKSTAVALQSTPKSALPSLQDSLARLDWYQFEKLMAAVFQQQGFTVQRSGGAQPDGGVDLLIEKQGEPTVVQCKHWKTHKVGVKEIREFLGTLTDTGIRNGTFITLHKFTDEARAFAHKHNIQLVDQSELLRLLESLNWKFNPTIIAALDNQQKCCPKCEAPMILRTAKKGPNTGSQFWGCTRYPDCRYTLSYQEPAD